MNTKGDAIHFSCLLVLFSEQKPALDRHFCGSISCVKNVGEMARK